MVNTENFINRLKEIIEENELSSSAFAEKLGVQRATISHLLSGRNKPSLDFIMKVIEAFPEVDLYWLLNGKGNYKKEETSTPLESPTETVDLFSNTSNVKERDTTLETLATNQIEEKISATARKSAPITKVIICYKDGSFDIFQND